MPRPSNPGRIAGLWYLLLVVLGPLRLIYIPAKLFVYDDPAATAANLVHHQTLFRAGMIGDLLAAFTIVFLTLAFYRLFVSPDLSPDPSPNADPARRLAVLVIILGGIMPALLYFLNVATDATTLMLATSAPGASAFSKPQQDAFVVLFLRFHDLQNTAAEALWGAWLLPLGLLVYRSRFLPRFLGIWLQINGLAYLALCATGLLFPHYKGRLFTLSQPALFGEVALMLWLVFKGGAPPHAAQFSVEGV